MSQCNPKSPSSTIAPNPNHSIAWKQFDLATIGFCQGLAIYYLLKAWDWQGVTMLILFPVLGTVMVTPLVAILALKRHSWKRDLLFALVVGLVTVGFVILAIILFFLLLGSDNREAYSNYFYLLFFVFLIIVALLLVLPLSYYQAARTAGRFTFPIKQLFLNLRANGLAFFFAGYFLGLCWLMLGIWAWIFKLIGIGFFAALFSKPLFIALFTGTAVGLGLALARENSKVFKWLLLPLELLLHLVISVIFR